MECWGYCILGACDVQDVGCWGRGMFGEWDVGDVGCWGCGMFKKWDVGEVGCSGCGMFAGMWDVDLENAKPNVPISTYYCFEVLLN